MADQTEELLEVNGQRFTGGTGTEIIDALLHGLHVNGVEKLPGKGWQVRAGGEVKTFKLLVDALAFRIGDAHPAPRGRVVVTEAVEALTAAYRMIAYEQTPIGWSVDRIESARDALLALVDADARAASQGHSWDAICRTPMGQSLPTPARAEALTKVYADALQECGIRICTDDDPPTWTLDTESDAIGFDSIAEIIEYVVKLRTPARAEGAGEVTEAMVEAGATVMYEGPESVLGVWRNAGEQTKDHYRALAKRCLTAALALVDADAAEPVSVAYTLPTPARAEGALTEAQQDEIEHAEGERIFDRVCEALNLNPNDGDCDSGDHADFIVSAVEHHIERLTLPTPARAEGAGKDDPSVLHPCDDWHEDIGPVLWWTDGEPPHCGTPLDSDFPHDLAGDDSCLGWSYLVVPAALNTGNTDG